MCPNASRLDCRAAMIMPGGVPPPSYRSINYGRNAPSNLGTGDWADNGRIIRYGCLPADSAENWPLLIIVPDWIAHGYACQDSTGGA
jgi:hypothetical protein